MADRLSVNGKLTVGGDKTLNLQGDTTRFIMNVIPSLDTGDAFQHKLQLSGFGDLKVFWGDGTNDNIPTTPSAITHTYPTTGDEYVITIIGGPVKLRYAGLNDEDDIVEIQQWGLCEFDNNAGEERSFQGAENLVISAKDVPKVNNTLQLSFNGCALINPLAFSKLDVSNVVTMKEGFEGCKSFNVPINDWDVSKCVNFDQAFNQCIVFNQPLNKWRFSSDPIIMSSMFQDCYAFNQDVGSWNVGSVTNMSNMFSEVATFLGGDMSFNNGGSPSISGWNVSSVQNFQSMFDKSISFNQPIGSWDVSSATTFRRMFRTTNSFNQDVGNWDVSNATNLTEMFQTASSFNNGGSPSISGWIFNPTLTSLEYIFQGTSFNQPVGAWDVSNIGNFNYVFDGCSNFDQNLSSWDVSSATTFNSTFQNTSFNNTGDPGISGWNVSNVTVMVAMFDGSLFNQPIGTWNVSNVQDMEEMFRSCPFNQDISNWDVSNVSDMNEMFQSNSNFNQPIGNWNTSSLTNITRMFNNATSFNQPLSGWDVTKINNALNFLQGGQLSTANYDATLNSWASQPLIGGPVTIHFGTSTYSSASSASRQFLIDTYGWTISDGGMV